mmetsp:Transcript_118106/g.381191  ORF Transcript_118106/g.381191 Transcript_118106/m.381191 type:complete len:281 (-) Transcript_118106:18-860(-)
MRVAQLGLLCRQAGRHVRAEDEEHALGVPDAAGGRQERQGVAHGDAQLDALALQQHGDGVAAEGVVRQGREEGQLLVQRGAAGLGAVARARLAVQHPGRETAEVLLHDRLEEPHCVFVRETGTAADVVAQADALRARGVLGVAHHHELREGRPGLAVLHRARHGGVGRRRQLAAGEEGLPGDHEHRVPRADLGRRRLLAHRRVDQALGVFGGNVNVGDAAQDGNVGGGGNAVSVLTSGARAHCNEQRAASKRGPCDAAPHGSRGGCLERDYIGTLQLGLA